MKKTNKKKLEEFIRVDHAGERGAIKIYEGQLLALNTIVKNDDLKQIIREMKKHEEEHSNFFEDEIEKRNQIEGDEKDLKEKIIKFRQDELDHKDIAYEKGATKKGLYSIMDKVIKTGSKVAIKISEKI